MTQIFGKYRGVVTNNLDPDHRGRLQVNVPAVEGTAALWAMPCVPYAGPGVGLLMLPPLGASVWVEFEGGNPSMPIWTGCFWNEAQDLSDSPDKKVLKTHGISLVIDDTPGVGGVKLILGDTAVTVPMNTSSSTPLEIKVAGASVTISPTEILLTHGAAKVEIQPGAVRCTAGSSALGLATTWTWPPIT